MKTETKKLNVLFVNDYSVMVVTVDAVGEEDAVAQAEQILADEFGHEISYNEVSIEEA